jgi:hypothetical protein
LARFLVATVFGINCLAARRGKRSGQQVMAAKKFLLRAEVLN